jgi:hypothetical protein
MFFLAALFFAPLAGMVPAYASAAALLYVACVMARGLAEIDWNDMTEAAPAVVAAITMPLTYRSRLVSGSGEADCRKVCRCQTGGAGAGARFRRQIRHWLADGAINPPAPS